MQDLILVIERGLKRLFRVKCWAAFNALLSDISNELFRYPPPRHPQSPVYNKANNSLLDLRSYLFNSLDFRAKISCLLFMANIFLKSILQCVVCFKDGNLFSNNLHVDNGQISEKIKINQIICIIILSHFSAILTNNFIWRLWW